MENSETTTTENTQRDAEVVAKKPDFSSLSEDTFINTDFTQLIKETVEEVKTDVKPEEKPEEKPVETELKLDEVKEETTEAPVAEAEVKDEVEEIPLTLDAAEQTPEEGSWLQVAKEAGIEGVTEDSFEAIKLALTKPLEDKLAELDSKKFEDYFKDIDPEIRMEIELNQAGLSLKDIKAPLENIARYRALDDVALYRESLVAKIEDVRDLTDSDKDWIDKQVEKAVEDGTVSHEANGVRIELDVEAAKVNKRYNDIIEKHRLNRDNFVQSKRNQEIESVNKAFDDMQEFMGSKLDETTRKGLAAQNAKGEYDQALNDPANKAKFIAFLKFGEIARKNLEAKSYMKGKTEITKLLHNTPPLEKGGAGQTMQTEVKEGFKQLENDPYLNGKK